MYTGNRCGGGLNFYPNVYTLVREEVSASAGTATHVHTSTYTYTSKWTRRRTHRRARVWGWIFPPLLSPFLSFTPFPCHERERERKGADSLGGQFKNQYWPRSSQSFIYRRGLLAARERRAKKIAALPFLLLPQHPLAGFRCHVVPNASWIMRSSSLQSLFKPSCYSPLRLGNESCLRKCE